MSGNNKIHCLQSKQEINGTETEGFAQFYASRVWNDPTSSSCTFTYYKQFLNANLTVSQPPVVKSCKNAIGANPKWMVTNCDSVDEGTEYDWMLFLYAINTAAAFEKTDFASLRNIMRTACRANTIEKCNFYYDSISWNGSNGLLPAAQTVYGGTADPRYVKLALTGVDTGINR